MAEFLPLCDVLFNVISLAGYFCDVVFDVVLSYALFERGRYAYFAVVITLVMVSLIISQIVSLRWYLHKVHLQSNANILTDSLDKKKPINPSVGSSINTTQHQSDDTIQSKIGRYCVIVLHCSQLGVLWRYAKLFVPVDLRHVKHEVRDLCMLRLVHAFCEAAPMLLLQLYILVTIQKEEAILLKPEIPLQSLGSGPVAPVIVQQPTITEQHQLRTFKDLNIVSCALSLFSVCWALASFSKNVRIQNVHRLVLTWLGVIFQFLWRLGTVISRVASLTLYASIYHHWIFMVIALHWISMFLWLISPKNVFHGERITRVRKATLAGLIAFVYVFAYINLQEVNHRQKMITFYVVMFLENSLLVFLWLIGIWIDKPYNWYVMPIWIFISFVTGISFMFLYYRYFHIRRLGYEAGGRLPFDMNSKYSCADGTSCISMDDNSNTCQKYSTQIPGVFNCRFSNPVGNGAARRKKKKPTTFVPPPNLNVQQSISTNLMNQNMCAMTTNTGLMSIPFWRRPISRSHTGGSENEGSAGSRVNIYQKLQEKKQKQLAELKIIEEEIKQGKLGGPTCNSKHGIGDDSRASLPRQPIPHVKKHINIDPQDWSTSSPEMHCAVGSAANIFNDLNVISSPNIDDINNLNKYTRNYDPLYNSFTLNGINIPAMNKESFAAIESSQRNMSPISSQISGGESNSMKRQIVPRTKIPHSAPRNPFSETYRSNFSNIFADGFINSNDRTQSISPRKTTDSPNRIVTTTNGSSNNNNTNNSKSNNNNSLNGIAASTVASHYDHSNLYLNHPRQISGTYSSNVENYGGVNLPFPYNVIPPPRSKLESRSNNVYAQQTSSTATPTNALSANHLNASQQQRLHLQRQMQRAKTPEILLAPHYLDNSRVYYDWVAREPAYRLKYGGKQPHQHHVVSSGDENLDDQDDSILSMGQNGYRIPSDIDSQVSLPRSYTLPREFKYYRRNKCRKLIKNEHFITSTNSSDGDVDSGDDNESERQSNLSNNSQHCLRLQSPSIVTKNVIVPSSNKPSRIYHHNHIGMSASATASPITVCNIHAAKEINKLSPSSSPLLAATLGQSNLINNLHMEALSSIIATNSNDGNALNIHDGNRPISSSPNYLNIMATGGDSNHLQRSIANNSNTDCGMLGSGAGILDLINGAESAAATGTALNRQMRLRAYGNNKNGMVRHETKL